MWRWLTTWWHKREPVTRPTNPCPLCGSREWCRCEFDFPFGHQTDER